MGTDLLQPLQVLLHRISCGCRTGPLPEAEPDARTGRWWLGQGVAEQAMVRKHGLMGWWGWLPT